MERYTLESVLRKGAELVKRKGIKCLVIDPFNKVRDVDCKTEDVNRYTMEYLSKIEIFAKKFDVLVFIVAHPTKMYKDGNGKIEEPTMYNIKGGGEWYDASYHGILVHRDYENRTVKAKVLKVKFQNLGENGAEAHFKWEPKSGCFIPHEPVDMSNEPNALGMSVGSKKAKEQAKRRLPDNYIQSKEEEEEAYLYCVKNNIIISPVAVKDTIGSWAVGISLPGKHKTVHNSPLKYVINIA